MAQIQPLKALHYDLDKVGGIEQVIAPPYDVIDPEQRAELLAQSPNNVVELDLPLGSNGDPYAHAGALLEQWIDEGVLVEDGEDALWVLEQEFVGPDGVTRTRTGFFAKVRLEPYGPGRVRPHERTHPGPKEDRLNLMRTTKANLSPIFSLYDDPDGSVAEVFEPEVKGEPWATFSLQEVEHKLWRVTDPAALQKVQESLARSELLIADGHHRYETARTYAEEVGGDGPHQFVLMCLVALQDPGLTVFPTHRLLVDVTPEQRAALRASLQSDWELTPTSIDELEPARGEAAEASGEQALKIGYLDQHERPAMLQLRNTDLLEELLPGKSKPYKQLDTAVLEALILKRALGMTSDDIDHFRGLWYARSAKEAIEKVKSHQVDAAFFMGPTPVTQIREVAEYGESMPPKTTYFYPKVPTGVVFNSLILQGQKC